MRDSILALASLVVLCCPLTACGSPSEENSARSARTWQSSAPVLAAKDAWLAAEVKSKLAAADFDTARSVSVSVRKGVATLRGTARSEPEIARLSDAAAGVRGISSVVTLVRADPKFRGSSEELRDVSLATKVSLNIAEQTGVNVLSVKTRARDGVVILEGNVPTLAVKSVMVEAATKTPGVTKIIDRLKTASAR